MPTRSPGRIRRICTGWPLIRVPLVLSRSVRITSSLSTWTLAWKRLTRSSLSRRTLPFLPADGDGDRQVAEDSALVDADQHLERHRLHGNSRAGGLDVQFRCPGRARSGQRPNSRLFHSRLRGPACQLRRDEPARRQVPEPGELAFGEIPRPLPDRPHRARPKSPGRRERSNSSR